MLVSNGSSSMEALSSKPMSAKEDRVLTLAALSESSSPASDPFFLDPFSVPNVSTFWFSCIWTRLSSKRGLLTFAHPLKATDPCHKSLRRFARDRAFCKLYTPEWQAVSCEVSSNCSRHNRAPIKAAQSLLFCETLGRSTALSLMRWLSQSRDSLGISVGQSFTFVWDRLKATSSPCLRSAHGHCCCCQYPTAFWSVSRIWSGFWRASARAVGARWGSYLILTRALQTGKLVRGSRTTGRLYPVRSRIRVSSQQWTLLARYQPITSDKLGLICFVSQVINAASRQASSNRSVKHTHMA